jgi:hypothetical protein
VLIPRSSSSRETSISGPPAIVSPGFFAAALSFLPALARESLCLNRRGYNR